MFNWFNSMFNLLGFLKNFSFYGKRRKTPEQQLYLGIALCGCLGIVLIIYSTNYLHDKNPVPDAVVYFTAPLEDGRVLPFSDKNKPSGPVTLLSEQVMSGEMAIRLKKVGAADAVRVVINNGDYSGLIMPGKFRYSTDMISRGAINISFSLVYESRLARTGGTVPLSMLGSTIEFTFFNTLGMTEMDDALEELIKENIHRKLDGEIAVRLDRLLKKENQPGMVSARHP